MRVHLTTHQFETLGTPRGQLTKGNRMTLEEIRDLNRQRREENGPDSIDTPESEAREEHAREPIQ